MLCIGLPLLAMALWGTFRVPGDAPVAACLALELAEFGAATWLLIDAGRTTLGIVLGAVLVLHYAASCDRVGWLLTGRK